jgi:hypothetical protein
MNAAGETSSDMDLIDDRGDLRPMDTVTTRRTVEDYAAELRGVQDGDSFEDFLFVEATAMDKVEFAADAYGSTDAERLAEVRDIIAALRIVRRETQARRAAAREAAGR